MSSREHNIPKKGPRLNKTGPDLKKDLLMKFMRAPVLLMAAALALADIPEFWS
jgi:hypothetical protein